MVQQQTISPGSAVDRGSFDTLVAFSKATGDSLRLNVLLVLRRQSYSVLELCQILEVKQPALSHHLKILATSGLVTSRREGNTIFYRRAPLRNGNFPELRRSLFLALDQLPLDAKVEKRMARIQQERTLSSKTFFREYADQFRAQQELIAGHEQYDETLLQQLDVLPTDQRIHAIEVGPGEGTFLPELARRFTQVTAIDNSEEMLAKAARLAREKNLENVSLLHGDTTIGKQKKLSAQCIVINMVLHHVPSPAELVEDCAAMLEPDGILLITELCSHDQPWAREACGDLWLGFDPDQLSDWGEDASLQETDSHYLALRNGFRVQVRAFQKPFTQH